MQNSAVQVHIPQVKSGGKANGIVGRIESFVEFRSFKRCNESMKKREIQIYNGELSISYL
jgi:hypothetical protein